MFKSTKFIFCLSLSVFYCFFVESSNDYLSIINGDESVSCEKLTDEFCKTLWSAENQGNFQFSNENRVLHGEKRQDVIDNARFIYNQKLAKSRCHLPEDLKKLAGIHCGPGDKKEDLLAQLEDLLSQVDSIKRNNKAIKSWKNSINRKIFSDFENIIQNTAYERSYKENPSLSEKLWSDYKPAHKKNYYGHYYDIKTEIMDAIYLKDSDWLKALHLFDEVQKDIMTVIDKISLTPEIKEALKEKVSSVKISLPYEDPRKTSSMGECTTYMNNAFYNSVNNTVYFCIGAININSESSTYRTMAHEIAHSIDPGIISIDVLHKTPLFHFLRQLYESNASLPCEEWKKQKNHIFVLPFEIHQLPEGMAKIDQCLVDRQNLSELNYSSLAHASYNMAKNGIVRYAKNNTFTYLTTPEVPRDGILQKNEFYMNPKFFAETRTKYLENTTFSFGYFHTPSVFVQEYKCLLEQSDVTEEQAFDKSLQETQKLSTVYQHHYLSVLGKNAKALIRFNLSKPSSEEFADWISYKTVELKLQRIPSLKKRREFVMTGTATYCKPTGLESIAKHKVLIEKKAYSNKKLHSPARERRLKTFTPKTAELLQCTRGEDIKKLYKNCDSVMENP